MHLLEHAALNLFYVHLAAYHRVVRLISFQNPEPTTGEQPAGSSDLCQFCPHPATPLPTIKQHGCSITTRTSRPTLAGQVDGSDDIALVLAMAEMLEVKQR
jgi:hypothetical protein